MKHRTAATLRGDDSTMAHQQLPDFDDERDNWKAYVIKAEAYFEALGVTESAKKRALLVAALSTLPFKY